MPRTLTRVFVGHKTLSLSAAYEQGRRDMAREAIVQATYWASTYPSTAPAHSVVADELWAFANRLREAHPNAV